MFKLKCIFAWTKYYKWFWAQLCNRLKMSFSLKLQAQEQAMQLEQRHEHCGETPEAEQRRLAHNARRRERLKNESAIEGDIRRAAFADYQRQRRAKEKPDQHATRLAQERERYRIDKESGKQRKKSLIKVEE
ncbi:hypothetical protein KR093_008079 [Drosophila rubida]|uniref:Uncharacterized protein n=1 Tax=Drosophila rubida TaxID=30044 RepID=A0AAD4PQE4_9MUSC|nr:hypothetical protein KR093_008079 [Drosophila rubida]